MHVHGRLFLARHRGGVSFFTQRGGVHVLGLLADGLLGELNAEQIEFPQVTVSRADHLNQIVNSILDASRLESDLVAVQRKEYSIEALLAQAWPMLEQHTASHSVRLDLSSTILCRTFSATWRA